jgi:hypothetical protein
MSGLDVERCRPKEATLALPGHMDEMIATCYPVSSDLDAVFGGSVVASKPLDSVFWRRVPRQSLGLSRMGVLVCSATMETPSAPPFMLQRLNPYLRPLYSLPRPAGAIVS